MSGKYIKLEDKLPWYQEIIVFLKDEKTLKRSLIIPFHPIHHQEHHFIQTWFSSGDKLLVTFLMQA